MLKVNFRTPEQEFEEQKIIFARDKKHWDEIQNSFPSHIENFQLSMAAFGKTTIRAFIECPKDVSEKDTRDAMNWMKSLNHKIDKTFREEQGTFSWIARMEIEDENGKYTYLILLEKCHPLTCDIKKVTKMVEVYESVCH